MQSIIIRGASYGLSFISYVYGLMLHFYYFVIFAILYANVDTGRYFIAR